MEINTRPFSVGDTVWRLRSDSSYELYGVIGKITNANRRLFWLDGWTRMDNRAPFFSDTAIGRTMFHSEEDIKKVIESRN